MHNLLEVKSRSELREWLRQNHDRGDGVLGGGQAGKTR